MMKQVLTLATLVTLEALRTRFFAVTIILLLIGFGLALFIGQITVTETTANQSSLLAAFLRLSAVYVVSLFVITNMVHEFQDNSIYLWLSLPIPRATYIIGKFSGFTLIASLTAILFGAALLFFVPYHQVGLWTLSLLCELLIVTALSLLCVLTFQHTVQVFSVVLGFYLSARTINTLQLMVQGPLNDPHSWIDQFMSGFIDLMAMLLPNLDHFTQSAWIVYHTGVMNNLLEIVVQTIIYVALLITMSLFDFYRKNL